MQYNKVSKICNKYKDRDDEDSFRLQLWDPDSCECRCRPEEWKECQTGYTYDGVYSCQCLPVVIEIGRESELCNSHH